MRAGSITFLVLTIISFMGAINRVSNGAVDPDNVAYSTGYSFGTFIPSLIFLFIFSRFYKKDNENQNLDRKESPEGLGGWLILVCIGMFLSTLQLIVQFFNTYLPIFTNGSWRYLTDSSSPDYNALIPPAIIIEMLINTGLAITTIVLIVLFFQKSKLFPKLYIGVRIFVPIFLLVDSIAINAIMKEATLLSGEQVKELFYTIIPAAIWIPYMIKSRRVKATFYGIREEDKYVAEVFA